MLRPGAAECKAENDSHCVVGRGVLTPPTCNQGQRRGEDTAPYLSVDWFASGAVAPVTFHVQLCPFVVTSAGVNRLNELFEGLRIAWGAIRANKLRSVLATLGIVIGVATVTLMGTAIEALNRAFLKSVSSLGADVFHVQRHGWFIRSHAEWLKAQNRREITFGHVRALRDQLTLAKAVAPVTEWRAPVRYGKRNSTRVMIIGTTWEYVFTSGVNLAAGRFFSDAESDGGRPICVIGQQVATNLFLHETPVGKTLRVGAFNFEVVGVLDKQGSFLGEFSLDNQVIIPMKQFVACFTAYPYLGIQVKAISLERLDESKEELRGVFRKIRRVEPGVEDDFAINQQEQFVETFHKVAGSIAAVGLFITGLSLFVGGIGIMNIMFVSVAERTREIGIRKAVGAKRRAILVQFLIEAASICLLGGVIALAIAYPVTLFMGKFMPASLSLPVATLALGVAAFTGIVSGFLPAWRAARLDVVEALRRE